LSKSDPVTKGNKHDEDNEHGFSHINYIFKSVPAENIDNQDKNREFSKASHRSVLAELRKKFYSFIYFDVLRSKDAIKN